MPSDRVKGCSLEAGGGDFAIWRLSLSLRSRVAGPQFWQKKFKAMKEWENMRACVGKQKTRKEVEGVDYEVEIQSQTDGFSFINFGCVLQNRNMNGDMPAVDGK